MNLPDLSLVPDEDLKAEYHQRFMGAFVKPRKPDRCPCGKTPLGTAEKRQFDCCKRAGVMPYTRGPRKRKGEKTDGI